MKNLRKDSYDEGETVDYDKNERQRTTIMETNQSSSREQELSYAEAITRALQSKKSSKNKIGNVSLKSNFNNKAENLAVMMRGEFAKVGLKISNPEKLDQYLEEKFVKERSEITRNMEKIKEEFSNLYELIREGTF